MHHCQPQFQPSFRGMHGEPLTHLVVKQCCSLLQPNCKLDSETALHHKPNEETRVAHGGPDQQVRQYIVQPCDLHLEAIFSGRKTFCTSVIELPLCLNTTDDL